MDTDLDFEFIVYSLYHDGYNIDYMSDALYDTYGLIRDDDYNYSYLEELVEELDSNNGEYSSTQFNSLKDK